MIFKSFTETNCFPQCQGQGTRRTTTACAEAEIDSQEREEFPNIDFGPLL